MNKLYYPAVFHAEDTGYSVSVPDLEGCFTQGDTLEEAMQMTQEAIGLFLDAAMEIKQPSSPESIMASNGDFVALVAFDKTEYARVHDSKAVKKTLTIPSWLNTVAEEQHINFSSVLQSALKQQLHIE